MLDDADGPLPADIREVTSWHLEGRLPGGGARWGAGLAESKKLWARGLAQLRRASEAANNESDGRGTFQLPEPGPMRKNPRAMEALREYRRRLDPGDGKKKRSPSRYPDVEGEWQIA